MHYFIVSFTYKNSSLELRESLNLSCMTQREEFLSLLIENHDFDEVMLPNTCNRIELIAYVKDASLAAEVIFEQLSLRCGYSVKELQNQADTYNDAAAIHHLFSVAASLDSLVVGETQIVGQLKDAMKFASDLGYCGSGLNQAMNAAFKCAAKIRSTTNISAKPVSIASIAVLKAKDEFGSLEGLNALVIGSGDMSRIACQNLLQHKANVTLINRTMSKAQKIADELDAPISVRPFEELGELINHHELLFTATSSKSPIIEQSMIQEQFYNRVWLDLAVPRDIGMINDEDIKVILVDDLEDIAKANIELRNQEARNSYAIVGEMTTEFFNSLHVNEMEPLIKDMYIKAFEAVDAETQRATKKGFIPKELEMQAHKMGTQIVKRFLHSISENMRDVSNTKSSQALMSHLAYLLNINETLMHEETKEEGK